MTGINVQTRNLLWLAALTAATILVALTATSSAYAATGEYGLQIPGGANQGAPPLDPGGAAPPTTAPSTGVAPTAPVTGEVVEGNGKSKKKGKGKGRKKPERKLPELGPAKPRTIAAPVSAVARGTTPGIVPLAAVLAGLLVTALVGRRLIRKQAA